MKSVPLAPDAVPTIALAIKARRPVTLKLKGKAVAKVQPILTVTEQEAARILREIAEADKGDDWADYVSRE
jgi:hypothetical protein